MSKHVSSTVIKCLDQLFTLCGTPSYIHSDRGTSFLSHEIKHYITQKGIATSKTTPYHPIGNGQCERYNGIIWKGVQLALKSHNLQISNWEMVLPSVLHSIRSLLSTATNTTPHERFFAFQRRSMCGMSLPSWLTTSGNVMLRRYVRHTKNDPLVDEVNLQMLIQLMHTSVTLTVASQPCHSRIYHPVLLHLIYSHLSVQYATLTIFNNNL